MNRLFQGSHAMVSQSRDVYSLIRQQGSVTRKFLVQQLALPATTVSRILERLIKAGLIVESGLADSSGGRRPSIYQTVGRARFILGLDLEENASCLVLSDLHLQTTGTQSLPGLAKISATGSAAPIILAAAELLQKNNLQPAQVLALGINYRPCADRDGAADQLERISQQIQNELQIPVYRTEAANPADKTNQILVVLSIGQTIDFLQIIPGQSRDQKFTSGKGGQIIVPSPDKAAGLGTTLAQLAATPALVQRFQRLKDNPALNWADFCQAVQAGKRKSGQILHEASAALAIAIVNVALLSENCHLNLNGQALEDLPEYETAILSQVEEMADRQGVSIKFAADGFDAAGQAAGAAAGVLEKCL